MESEPSAPSPSSSWAQKTAQKKKAPLLELMSKSNIFNENSNKVDGSNNDSCPGFGKQEKKDELSPSDGESMATYAISPNSTGGHSSHSSSSTMTSSGSEANEGLVIEIPPETNGKGGYYKQQGDNISGHNERLKIGFCRTIVALFFLLVSMISNLVILAIVHDRVPMDIEKPLPDISFDLLPKADWALDIAEYAIVAYSVMIITLLILHRYRQIILRRLALIMGLLYFFRAICMISTVFPLANNKYYCSPQIFNQSDPNHPTITTGEYIIVIINRVFHLLIGFGLSINGQHTYCGDYLYSGHTVILVLSYLMLREYLMPSRCRTFIWKLVNILLFLLSFGAILCVCISRGHYLIDILLAYYITTRIFWVYHTLVYNQGLMFKSTNYLLRVWWLPLLRYFEGITHECRGSSCEHLSILSRQKCNCDVPFSMIPRSFEWPLPWPRILKRRSLKCHQRLLPTLQA